MPNVNPNIHFPHGVDAFHSDVTAPVIITEAEKSALAFKALRAAQRASEIFQRLAAVASLRHFGNGTASCFSTGVLRLNSETDEGEQMGDKKQTMYRKYWENIL